MVCKDIAEYGWTIGDARAELQQIEDQLASRFHIRRHVRKTLLSMARNGQLEEDKLVRDWHQSCSIYFDWLASERIVPPDVSIGKATAKEEAAQAAFSLLCPLRDMSLRDMLSTCHAKWTRLMTSNGGASTGCSQG